MLIRFTGIFVAAALTAGVANAKDITLRWGHYLGDSPFLQAEKDFATNVTERTEGRVKVEITYAGGLGAGNEVLTLAGRGAIDVASVVPGHRTASRFVLCELRVAILYFAATSFLPLARAVTFSYNTCSVKYHVYGFYLIIYRLYDLSCLF